MTTLELNPDTERLHSCINQIVTDDNHYDHPDSFGFDYGEIDTAPFNNHPLFNSVFLRVERGEVFVSIEEADGNLRKAYEKTSFGDVADIIVAAIRLVTPLVLVKLIDEGSITITNTSTATVSFYSTPDYGRYYTINLG